MMKKLFACLVAVCAMAIAANAANYSIDEASVDSMIAEAVEVAPAALEASLDAPAAGDMIGGKGSDTIVAFILAVIPVTGWLAIHRIYLGTSLLTVILNIVTGAGFGVLYVVDWVALLLDAAGLYSAGYAGNPHWIALLNLL